MMVEGMRFNLKELTLDDVMWLRDHHKVNAEHYQAPVTLVKPDNIADLRFSVAVNFTAWNNDIMKCLNEILSHFNPTE